MQNGYIYPEITVTEIWAEGVLCLSSGSGTDDLKTDDSWSDIFGGTGA